MRFSIGSGPYGNCTQKCPGLKTAVTRTATQVPISGSVTDESILSQNTSTKSCSSSPTSGKTEIVTVRWSYKEAIELNTWAREGVYRKKFFFFPEGRGTSIIRSYRYEFCQYGEFTFLQMEIRTLISSPAAWPCLVIATHSSAQVL